MNQALKQVLFSLLLSSGFVSTVAGAATLECGQKPLETFSAELNTADYRQGKTLLFTAENAEIRVGYAAAQRMTCAGHTLGDLHCAGFWFGTQDHLAQVRIRKTADGYVAFFNWYDQPEMKQSLKPCVVK